MTSPVGASRACTYCSIDAHDRCTRGRCSCSCRKTLDPSTVRSAVAAMRDPIELVAVAPVFELVPTSGIEPGANVRVDDQGLDALAASILKHGILQPITVVPTERDADRYECLFGHRRLAAAKKAKLLHVPCLVRPRGREEVRVLTQIAENRDRRAMSPLEEAIAYQQLHKLGMTRQAIADAVGTTGSAVGDRLMLLDYPAPVTSAVHFRRLGLTDALAIPLELAKSTDGRTLAAVCRRGGGYARKWVREQIAERAAAGQVIEKRKRYETFNLDSDLIDEVRVAASTADLKVVEWIRQAIRCQLDMESVA